MFRHILLPTDGSRLSAKAVRAGIEFARETGARVTAYCALEPVPLHLYGEGYVPDRKMVTEFQKRTRAAAEKHVAAIARAAAKAGISFDSLVSEARTPYHGIVEAAARRRCDVIFMASHGHRGLMRLALGSVTEKVMKLTRLPVLVYR